MSRWLLQFAFFGLMATAVCVVVGRDARFGKLDDARPALAATDCESLPVSDGAGLIQAEPTAPLSAVLIKSTVLALTKDVSTFDSQWLSPQVDHGSLAFDSCAHSTAFAEENLRLRI